MKQQNGKIQEFDKMSREEINRHKKSGYAMLNQHRDFQNSDKFRSEFRSEEVYRRNMEGL